MTAAPEFATPDLSEAIEALTPEQIDQLPYGVIRLDPQGVVSVYNSTEARLSGRGDRPTLGHVFFTDIAPCMDNDYFKGKILCS